MHWLVDAAMAELQLVGAEAQRPTQHLVAEADPEHRLDAEHALDGGDRAVGGGGVAGSVREEHPVGIDGEQVCGRRRRGKDVDLAPTRRHVTRCRGLDAEVHGRDSEPLSPPTAGTT